MNTNYTLTLPQLLVVLLLLLGLMHRCSSLDQNFLNESNHLLDRFYERYNATKEVDLVFVLDRSGSVPRHGWMSMLKFIRKVLEHFTIDRDNTRVAVVTFSTTARVEVNDLDPRRVTSNREHKCTLFTRLESQVDPLVPTGYTATYDALNKTYTILLNSRPSAKKAVLVLTDGKSNIGPPPVKIAVDILSLRWDTEWDDEILGPQVEIYAFGVADAYERELHSIASHLPQHVWLIPKFSLFADLARSLHGGLQDENWVPTNLRDCGATCASQFAMCMCGSKTGSQACVCQAGMHMQDGNCTACPIGSYKDNYRPESCRPCPMNMTTRAISSTSESDCFYKPGHRRCSSLPDISNGVKFKVKGMRKDEVFNTKVSCDEITDGNSCHYECGLGFRLSGSPVMVCNHSGEWEGDVPNCDIVNCRRLEKILGGDLLGGDLAYQQNDTNYGALINVTCHAGSVPMPTMTSFSCDHHGRWTMPANFKCQEVFCVAIHPAEFMSVTPTECTTGSTAHGTVCNLTCADGFLLDGPPTRECGYFERAIWLPPYQGKCRDVQAPFIECPTNVTVTVSNFGDQQTTVHYDWRPPVLQDNSGYVNYTIKGFPEGNVFPIGHSLLRFVARDREGNTETCLQDVHVLEKVVENTFCPANIALTGRKQVVTWPNPVFMSPEGASLSHVCTPPIGTQFIGANNTVICYHGNFPSVTCTFNVSVTAVECPDPSKSVKLAHGAFSCGTNVNVPKICWVMCHVGYSARGMGKQAYRCRHDGSWSPALNQVPKCAKTSFGSRTTMGETIHVRYDGDCEENKKAIKEAFEETMRYILTEEFGPCSQPHTCTVQNVNIHCGATQRRRRHATRITKRSTDEPNANIAYELVVSREPESFNESSEMTEDDQRRMVDLFEDVFNNVTNTVVDANFSFEAHGTLVQGLSVEMHSEVPEIPLNCSEKEITVVEADDIYSLFASCVFCAAGTYRSEGMCKSCPVGMYQSQDGQDHCDQCPAGTSTTHQAAWDSSQCKAACPEGFASETGFEPCTPVCPKGHFAATGWEPCVPCRQGAYQPDQGQTSCLECPVGTTTAKTGAHVQDQCGTLCPNNTFSREGLEPCETCPAGTYQPLEGQNVECRVCDYVSPTQEMKFWCPDPVDCEYYNTECVNGLCIVSHVNRSQCVCHAGYHGDACELNINECESDPCLNGGTCEDSANGYMCNCTDAFTGPNCDVYVGACTRQPCMNGGSCVDRNLTYECICHASYNGSQCEQEVDPCSTTICQHGACVTHGQLVFCQCFEGFAGERCEKVIDYCSNITCLHGGTCFSNGTDVMCTCTRGKTGASCEKQLDYCTPDPCHDNGRCINTGTTHYCVCENGFYGEECAQASDTDFDLHFDEKRNQYVEVPVWDDLSEVTVCLWARTSGWATNSGTLFSYSAVSNWITTSFADVFTIYDLGDIKIIINGEYLNTKRSLVPGYWHHLCTTWDGETGNAHLYINGTQPFSWKVAQHTYMEGGGVFTLGQRQVGRFQQYFVPTQGFTGEISHLNVYDYILNTSDIQNMANDTSCHSGHGNVVSWTSTLNGLNGGVQKIPASHCLDLNECQYEDICEEDEICFDLIGTYECQKCTGDCPGQYDSCSSSPCANGGLCNVESRGFSCNCPKEFTGVTCEIIASDCSEITCHNRGQCKSLSGGVWCDCVAPWTGRFCDIKYQPTCDESPCLHNGTCVPDAGVYTCICPEDGQQYGHNCEVLTACDVNPGPCLDGATCVALDNGNFTCVCRDGRASDECLYVSTTTVRTTTVPIDHCHNVHCQNGGTCRNDGGKFVCQCDPDYSGLYCNELNPKETRRYHVTVSLNKKYNPGLKESEAFKEEFKHEVHNVYASSIRDGKLRVTIDNIRPGSVEVDFTLHHTVYLDGISPGPGAMQQVIYSELEENKLGTYSASLHNFKFNYVNQSNFMKWGIYLTIALAMITVIAVIVIGVYIGLRKRRTSGPKKLNNMPLIELNRVENPAFIPDSAPPTPRMRHMPDDNIYSDLSEPSPYAIDLCSGGKGSDPDLVKNFPSKRSKEVNKDWAAIHRQSIPLPPKPGEAAMSNGREDGGYLQPCKGNPPPSYKDVNQKIAAERYGHKNLNIESNYIAPMSAREERYGGDDDPYLKPIEEEKDNRNRAQSAKPMVYENTPEEGDDVGNGQVTYLSLFSTSPDDQKVLETDEKSPDSDFSDQASRSESPDYLLLREPDDGHPTAKGPPPPKLIIRDIKPNEASDNTGSAVGDEAPKEPPPPVPVLDSPPPAGPPPLPLESPPHSAEDEQFQFPVESRSSSEMPRENGDEAGVENAELTVSMTNDNAEDLDKSIPVADYDRVVYAIRSDKSS